MKTVNGIELNLNESDIHCEIFDLKFYFSSQKYLEKFVFEVKNYVETEKRKIELKYNMKIELNRSLIIAYYKKIEKRGFRVYDTIENKEISENVIFSEKIIKY